LGDPNSRKKQFIDKNFKTQVWRKVLEKDEDPRKIQDILDDVNCDEGDEGEFERIQLMIEKYNLEYGGGVPLYDLKDVKTLFALATNGKVLEDYVTWAATPDYWEKREASCFHIGTICMNELRLNYIKKEVKGCAGNSTYRDEKCRRDTQNEVPFRLSVSNLPLILGLST